MLGACDWDSKVLTSLVGLAAWSRDSRQKRGHRAYTPAQLPLPRSHWGHNPDVRRDYLIYLRRTVSGINNYCGADMRDVELRPAKVHNKPNWATGIAKFDLPGGTGGLVPRQRQEARASGHPGAGAAGPIYVCVGGHPPRQRNAQDAAAAQRGGSQKRALGAPGRQTADPRNPDFEHGYLTGHYRAGR